VQVFQSSPEGVASETYFYRVPELVGTEHDPFFLEKEFSTLESTIAPIVSRWIEEVDVLAPGDQVRVDAVEREEMSLYIALQFFRTLEQRDILAAFAAQEVYRIEISRDERINLHASMLWESGLVNALADRIHDSIWIFARNTTATPFMTSDNPVCVKTPDNRMWLKASGIFSPGTYTVFPLSPTVVLYCKEPTHWAAVKRFDGCVSPVLFSPDMVEHENSGQAFMASRYIFSCRDDFTFVRGFIPSIGTDLYAPKSHEGPPS
jgi:hypothetical protein